MRAWAYASVVAMAILRTASALPPTYPSVPMSGVAGPMEMPMVGLGTWQYNTSVAFDAVNSAFDVGYRHVDTALGCEHTTQHKLPMLPKC